MFSLEHRRALVCGSTRGIGRATAGAFARAGAAVVLLARNAGELEAVRDSLPTVPDGKHEFLVADFSDSASVRSTVQGYLAKFPPFHILVNNAGGPPPGAALEATEDAFRAAFTMHLLCSQALVQTLVPGMRAAQYGRIVNIVSTSVREPIKGLGVSNTIRAAMAGWAKTLSKELGPSGITVNNVLPGYTKTGRLEALINSRVAEPGASRAAVEGAMLADVPLGRFAEAEEIAAVILFLASPAAGYVTGVSLPVDGGRLASI